MWYVFLYCPRSILRAESHKWDWGVKRLVPTWWCEVWPDFRPEGSCQLHPHWRCWEPSTASATDGAARRENLCRLTDEKWYLSAVLVGISLITSDSKLVFVSLSAILISFWGEEGWFISLHFSTGVSVLGFSTFKSSLYSKDIILLSVVYTVKDFSQFVPAVFWRFIWRFLSCKQKKSFYRSQMDQPFVSLPLHIETHWGTVRRSFLRPRLKKNSPVFSSRTCMVLFFIF